VLLAQMETALEEEAMEAFERFQAMVYARNATVNLTAIKQTDSPLLNFADSLSALPYIEGASTVCDIGSGAGFPGVVLAIAQPGIRFTLMEPRKKRVAFLSDVVQELGLKNAQTVRMRAEEAGRDPEFRERFDIVTARALAAAPVICEYAMPLLRVGGRLIAYKGTMLEEEKKRAQKALTFLGGAGTRTVDVAVPGLSHTLFIAEKTGNTPGEYPRRTGVPEKNPLA